MDHELPIAPIEATPVEQKTLDAFVSEDDFNRLLVDLMIEVGSYVCVAANAYDPTRKTWSRDEAVIGGNLVRLYKLISALLDQMCQRRGEIAFILARLICETAINVSYLLKNDDRELSTAYVRYSLRHKRKLRDRVLEDDQPPSATGKRILMSVDRAARFAEVNLDDINPREQQKGWGNTSFRDRIADVGLEDAYLATFGGPSDNVHGGWSDLYTFHLEAEEPGRFKGQFKRKPLRPQVPVGLAHIVLLTLDRFFEFVQAEAVRAALGDLDRRLRLVREAHERYLSKRGWQAAFPLRTPSPPVGAS